MNSLLLSLSLSLSDIHDSFIAVFVWILSYYLLLSLSDVNDSFIAVFVWILSSLSLSLWR